MRPSIVVSSEKCVNCGLCGRECPEGLFVSTATGTRVESERLCMTCGHCVAVCPRDAITHSANGDRFSIVDPAEGPSPIHSFLLGKRSVRHFSNREIPGYVIEEITRVGDHAPSAHNFRNRRYDIVRDPRTINRVLKVIERKYKGYLLQLNPLTLFMVSLFNKAFAAELSDLVKSFRYAIREFERGNDVIFHGSKAIVCVSAPSYSGFSRDDCIAAQHYMMLAAKDMGVESFIVGFAQYVHRSIERALKLERGLSIYAISAFGYSDTKFLKGIRFPVRDIRWN